MAKKKTKKELIEEENINFINSVCNNNLTLKISFKDAVEEFTKIHYKYSKKKYKNLNMDLKCMIVLMVKNASAAYLKSLLYWDLENKINNIIFNMKIEILMHMDILEDYFYDEIDKIYLKAIQLEELEQELINYCELLKLNERTTINTNKLIEEVEKKLSQYTEKDFLKSPYFCKKVKTIIIEQEEINERNKI